MKKFQRKLSNPLTGVDKSFDCDIRCDQCKNLPNYFIEWSDEYGDYGDTGFYCEKHNPEQPQPTKAEKREWNKFVNDDRTQEQKERDEWLKLNIALMERGFIL